MQPFIFTECFNTAKIARIALESFHKYHDLKVHVFGREEDFAELGDIANHRNTVLVDMNAIPGAAEGFKAGHLGTARLFAHVYSGRFEIAAQAKEVIHFDSDVVFLREAISLLKTELDRGYDIVGSRRCYKNNPVGIPVPDGVPDTISTYFFGMRISAIAPREPEYFVKMCQGGVEPFGHIEFDFFDPVTHECLRNGGKIMFLDSNVIGGQNEKGSKINDYDLNMHMDCGSALVHFGGVGSGYAYFNGLSKPEESYGKWATGRWSLFAKVFYDQNIIIDTPAKYAADGRWVNGDYNDKILHDLRKILRINQAHAQWLKDNGEAKRREYNLHDKSLVWDVGGYKGGWAVDMYCKYGCEILVFEPVKSFSEQISQRFKYNSSVKVMPFGLSGKDKDCEIYLNADSSSTYQKNENPEEISLCDINRVMTEWGIERVDLIKINVEGEEYSILKSLIESDNVTKFQNIQVQFHSFIDNADNLRMEIHNQLSKTHRLTYNYAFIWENWEIK